MPDERIGHRAICFYRAGDVQDAFPHEDEPDRLDCSVSREWFLAPYLERMPGVVGLDLVSHTGAEACTLTLAPWSARELAAHLVRLAEAQEGCLEYLTNGVMQAADLAGSIPDENQRQTGLVMASTLVYSNAHRFPRRAALREFVMAELTIAIERNVEGAAIQESFLTLLGRFVDVLLRGYPENEGPPGDGL